MRTLLLLNVFAPEELGQRIRQAREEAGLTQRELADLINLGMRQLQNLEAGSSKPYAHLRAIAEATGKPVDWLLNGDDSVSERTDAALEEIRESLAELTRLVQELRGPSSDD